jgi:hypothetical protein
MQRKISSLDNIPMSKVDASRFHSYIKALGRRHNMGDSFGARFKAVYLLFFAGIVLTDSQGTATAQEPLATPSASPSPSLSVPEAVPPLNQEFQGVPPAVGPLEPPGQIAKPKPIFSEPVSPIQSGIAQPPVSSINAPPATPLPTPSKPANDISLSDLKASSDVRFRLGATVRATYDSNIFIQSRNEVGDLYSVLAPSFSIGSGSFDEPLTARQHTFLTPQGFSNTDLLKPRSAPFIYLSYTPSYTAFLDRTDQNSFDHDVIAETQFAFQRLTLGAFARFQTFRLPNTDLGNRISEKLTSVQAYAIYTWSPKTQLNAQIFFQHQEYKTAIGSDEIWNEDWLDYQYSPKTSFGPGIAVGTLIPTAGPEQVYGRVQARVTWNPTEKLSFSAKGGVELRSVSGAGEKVYPIYGVEGRYSISDRASAALSVYQQITSSAAIQTVDDISNGVTLSVQQEILDRFTFDFAVGYMNTSFDSFSGGTKNAARNDNSFFLRPNLTTAINRWVDCAVGIQYQNYSSSVQNRGFEDFLATYELRFKF